MRPRDDGGLVQPALESAICIAAPAAIAISKSHVTTATKRIFGRCVSSLGRAAAIFLLLGTSSALPAEESPLGDRSLNLITINLDAAPLSEALSLVANELELSLILANDVEGNINLYLNDVSAGAAWDAIMKTANLQYELVGEILQVFGPTSNIIVESVQLQHIPLGSATLSRIGALPTPGDEADSVIERDQELSHPLLQTLISSLNIDLKIALDLRSNRVILYGPRPVVESAKTLLLELDVPVAQILIEAQIIEVSQDLLDALGVSWGGIYRLNTTGGLGISQTRIRTEPTNDLSGARTTNFFLDASLEEFNIALAAFIDQGDARILSSPRIVTQNNREAYIASGEEIIIPSGTDQVGNLAFKEKQVALELGVTPRVLGDSRINLVIRLRNDALDFELGRINNSPPLRINALESIVTLADGEAVVIGGVTTSARNVFRNRNPFVSRIPLIGWMFRGSLKESQRRELVVIVKPTIIRSSLDFPQLTPLQQEISEEGARSLEPISLPEPSTFDGPNGGGR